METYEHDPVAVRLTGKRRGRTFFCFRVFQHRWLMLVLTLGVDPYICHRCCLYKFLVHMISISAAFSWLNKSEHQLCAEGEQGRPIYQCDCASLSL